MAEPGYDIGASLSASSSASSSVESPFNVRGGGGSGMGPGSYMIGSSATTAGSNMILYVLIGAAALVLLVLFTKKG